MSKISYFLEIRGKDKHHDTISKILGVSPNKKYKYKMFWRVESRKSISYLLELLDGKYALLKKVGVKRDDISIWVLYEYEQQCNLEFNPKELEKLGENGLTLCVSCWEKDSYITFDNVKTKTKNRSLIIKDNLQRKTKNGAVRG